jgi:hypothetical protein
MTKLHTALEFLQYDLTFEACKVKAEIEEDYRCERSVGDN